MENKQNLLVIIIALLLLGGGAYMFIKFAPGGEVQSKSDIVKRNELDIVIVRRAKNLSIGTDLFESELFQALISPQLPAFSEILPGRENPFIEFTKEKAVLPEANPPSNVVPEDNFNE